MSTTPTASPLRYATPAQMFFCVILFFMPWVEVQCANDSDKAPTWQTVATQSGMQVAAGRTVDRREVDSRDDTNAPLASLVRWMKNQVESGPGSEKVSGVPLLWLYPLAAFAAVVVGFALPSNSMRKYILAACCAVTLFAAGRQAVVGFPITKAVEQESKGEWKAYSVSEISDWTQSNEDTKQEMRRCDGVRVVFRVWFYIALLVPFTALLTTLAEPLGLRATESGYVLPPGRG